MALALQIALSLFVLYSVRNKKYWFFGLAVLIHASLVIPEVYYQGRTGSFFAIEGLALAVAVFSIIYISRSRKTF